ncbi:dTDP-4-dehydrorhamnose reductase [Pseudochelatococcus sp. B33]
MRILVFGRTGQVARELARRAPEATFLDRRQADLTDPAACAAAVRTSAADVVINAAAYTAVDQAESEVATAHLVNADAPGAMARSAADLGIPFLHVSTDYVFDGSGTRAWQPPDAVAPLNAYGHSKLAGERAVREAGGAHIILRTSWVFSAHGANFVKTMLRLGAERSHLRIVADQIGGPTPAADIAASLLSLASALHEGARGGTHHYAGAPETSWVGFAREIFSQAGLSVDVEEISSAEYPTPARRPLNSRLDCTTLAADFGIPPPDWREGLAQVIADLKEA